jgi:hypothetical protein
MTREARRRAFAEAMREAREALDTGDTGSARKALWQAHQIGRDTTLLHVISHFALMRFALRTRNWSEAWSQALLTVVALLITWLRPRAPQTHQSSG